MLKAIAALLLVACSSPDPEPRPDACPPPGPVWPRCSDIGCGEPSKLIDPSCVNEGPAGTPQCQCPLNPGDVEGPHCVWI